MNEQAATPSTPFSAPNAAIAGAPEGAPHLSGAFIRQALLGKAEIPPDCPLRIDDRGARMEGAIVEGGLDLSELDFGRSIEFERCTFLGAVSLRHSSFRYVSLAGSRAPHIDAELASIRTSLTLSGARLESPGKVAFNGYGLRVEGSVFLNHGFVAFGAVVLMAATIGMQLRCDNCALIHPFASASASNKDFTRRWIVDASLSAINATNARIHAITLMGTRIEGLAVFLSTTLVDNFVVAGGVSFLAGGGARSGLYLLNCHMGGSLVFQEVEEFEGTLLLGGCVAHSLADDGSVWRDPKTGRLRDGTTLELDDFHYDGFTDPVDAHTDVGWRTRLQWLKMQPNERLAEDFKSQPFTHLAEVLAHMGDAHGARMILFERERLRLKAKNVGLWEKLGGHVLGALAGYGYKNHYAFYWALGVWLLGALVFGVADRLGEMRPADPHVLAEAHYQETLRPPTDYEPVKPALYSLDLLLPIIEIGQQEYWIPRDADERTPDARAAFPRLHHSLVLAVNWLFSGWLAKAYYYFEIGMGWLLVSIVIAGFSGLLGHAREE